MTKVFISYSRKDKAFAEKLNSSLQEIGLGSWIDWIDIPPTANWWDQIEKGIESADAFLFLLSPDSVISEVCGREINHAIKNGKRLIPLIARDVNSQDVNDALRKLNWIYFREQDDFETSLKKLEAGIKTDLLWVESHRRLQVRSIEWERRKDRSLLLRGKDLREAEEGLASAGQKDPQPTDLQRQYVLESRRRESQTRNTVLAIGGVTMVILAFLSVFALNQRNLANNNALTAVANQNIAIANEQEAIRQSKIALARQLAAQAQFVFAADPARQELAVLLATHSMQLFPTGEAAEILETTTLTPTVARMNHHEPVTSVAFSPDGKYVLSDSKDGIARVWVATTGNEVAQISHDAEAVSAIFSPDGNYVLSGITHDSIGVWEVSTGNEVAHMSHENTVTSIAFRWDSRYIASGSEDGTARVWDTVTGNEVARMIHDGVVTAVAFSPDGNSVLSGGEDHTARVWEATTGAEIARMTHDASVSSLTFYPGGGLIASGDFIGEIRIWEAGSGNEVSRMSHSGPVISLAFSWDAEYVLAGGGYSANVWEVLSGNQVSMAHYNDYDVRSAALSPDGSFVVSRGGDGSARISMARSDDVIKYIAGNVSVNSIVFSGDGKYVAVGECAELLTPTCRRGSVRVFESATGQEVAHMPHQAGVWAVAFSPDDKYVLSGSEDGSVHIWRTTSEKEIAAIPDAAYAPSITFSSDSNYVVAGRGNDSVDVWESATGNEVFTIPEDFWGRTVLRIDDKYERLSIAEDEANVVQVWDAATGDEIARLIHDFAVTSASFSRDGKYVVSASGDTIRIWGAATGNELARMTHDSRVISASFSPGGKYVVSASEDQIVRVWDVATAKEIAQMVHGGPVRSMAFSPDERFVASASCDQFDAQTQLDCLSSTVLVWDASTADVFSRMNYEKGISDVAFSPDGNYVAVSGGDSVNLVDGNGEVLIWETSTGLERVRMFHDLLVSAVTFSPDGRYVASGSEDGVLRIWVWQPQDLIQDACSRVTRNLTRVEWAQYIPDQPFPAKQDDAICPNWSIEGDIIITPTATQ